MYYLIYDTSDNDYNYLFSVDGRYVTFSGEWADSTTETLTSALDTGGNWSSIAQLKADSSFKFICSSPNPITPNSHPELFI